MADEHYIPKVRPFAEGLIRKGGVNPPDDTAFVRPPPPAALRPSIKIDDYKPLEDPQAQEATAPVAGTGALAFGTGSVLGTVINWGTVGMQYGDIVVGAGDITLGIGAAPDAAPSGEPSSDSRDE